MKKWTHLMLAAAATVALLGNAQARDMEAIAKDGTIKMATEGAFAPFNHYEGEKLTGFEVELAEAVAKKLGLKVEWKALSFDGLLTGLQQDRWDLVIASHGITPERAEAVTFAEPHYCSGGIIVSKDSGVKTADDLKGKKVSVQTGTSYWDNVAKIDGIKETKNYPTDDAARNAVLTKRADAQVTDRFLALEFNKKNPQLGLQLGDMLFEERIAAAVQKGNTDLAETWNKALAEMMKDGSYVALSEKYFGEDVSCAPEATSAEEMASKATMDDKADMKTEAADAQTPEMEKKAQRVID